MVYWQKKSINFNPDISAEPFRSSTELERELQLVHEEIMYEYPFTNLAHFYHLDQQETPLKFGGDCYEANRYFADRIEQKKLGRVYFLGNKSTGFDHQVSLVENSTGTYLFDPVLQHRQLINLSTFTEMAVYDAYPEFKAAENGPVKKYFEIKKEGQHILKVKNGLIADGKRNQNSDKDFLFDLRDKKIEQPTVKERNAINAYYNQSENQLVLRILDKKDNRWLSLVYPVNLLAHYWPDHPAKAIDLQQLQIRPSDGTKVKPKDLSFDIFFNQIAAKLNVTRNELMHFIMVGIELYFKHKPVQFTFRSGR